jgi:hypothetical protein
VSDQVSLEELAWKYRALVRLRRTREEAIAQGLSRFPADQTDARREAMRELATHFPGSLRELDESSAVELESRLVAVTAALDGGPTEPWMSAAILFHRTLRAELEARRSPNPARPATGRILDGVWDVVARALRISAREAELLVYPKAPVSGTRR